MKLKRHKSTTEIAVKSEPEDDVSHLITAFDAHLPVMVGHMADLFGRAAPRISARERRKCMNDMQRRLRRLWPDINKLDDLKGKPDSPEKLETVKSAIRGVLIQMLAPASVRKAPNAAKLDWLIGMAAKATEPPRGSLAHQAPYLEARTHLWKFLIGVYSRLPLATVWASQESWPGDEHRRYIHSLRLFTLATRRFRSNPTRTISDKAAIDLQEEYSRAANLFEQQLRLMTSLARAAPGTLKPWEYWQQQNLKNLLEMAAIDAELGKLVQFIDRNVRNALTHGPPIIERGSRNCHFRDRGVLVTWTWEEYFARTRALTLAVLACSQMDSFRQLIEIQILSKFLAPSGH